MGKRKKNLSFFEQISFFENAIEEVVSRKTSNTPQDKVEIPQVNIKDLKVINIQRIKTRQVPEPENVENIVKEIREGKLSESHLYFKTPKIPTPNILEELLYIQFLPEIEQEKYQEYLNKLIKLPLTLTEEKDPYSKIKIKESKNNAQQIIEEYKTIYEKIKIPEKIRQDIKYYDLQDRLLYNSKKIATFFKEIIKNFYVMEKESVNIVTNSVNPIPFIIKNVNSIGFIEIDPVKKYIGLKLFKNPVYIGDNFSENLIRIEDQNTDIAIINTLDRPRKIKEAFISVDKKEKIEIKRNAGINGIIKQGMANEYLVQKYCVPTKVKDYGLVVYIGEKSENLHEKLINNKNEYILVPLVSILFKDEETDLNLSLTVNGKLPLKDFRKTSLNEDKEPFYVNSIEELQEYIESPEIKKDIEEFNNLRNQKNIKSITSHIIKEITNELSRNQETFLIKKLKEIEKNIEKSTDIEEINQNIIQIGIQTRKLKKIKGVFLIETAKQSRKRILSTQEEEQFENIMKLSENLYKQAFKSDENFTLFISQIVKIITSVDKKEGIKTLIEIAKFPTTGQMFYVKPFDFIFSKKDFINLIKIKSNGPRKKEEMENKLKTYIYEHKTVQKSKKEREKLKAIAQEIKVLIEAASNKQFKNLHQAVKYISSEDFPGNINRLKLAETKKKIKYPQSLQFAEIIRELDKKKNLEIIYKNSLNALKAQYPAVVKRMQDLYKYIDGKEELFSKYTIRKTLEKIEKLKEEIEKFKTT